MIEQQPKIPHHMPRLRAHLWDHICGNSETRLRQTFAYTALYASLSHVEALSSPPHQDQPARRIVEGRYAVTNTWPVFGFTDHGRPPFGQNSHLRLNRWHRTWDPRYLADWGKFEPKLLWGLALGKCWPACDTKVGIPVYAE